MTKHVEFHLLLESDVAQLIERLAKEGDVGVVEVVTEAIRTYAESESELIALADEGERDIDEGRFHTQSEMKAWLAERMATARAAMRAKAA